ncbi:MAG: hypothetical protein N2C14_07895, partial [Planctomycetales bacterium]
MGTGWELFASTWTLELGTVGILVAAFSLVYAATRHERPKIILKNAAEMGVMISLFMAVVFVLLVVWDYLL